MIKINSQSKRSRMISFIKGNNDLNIRTRVQGQLVYMYLLNMTSVSSPYCNKIKRKAQLGK